MTQPGTKFYRSTEGAAAAEFALISPVFFLMVFGMIAFGIWLSASNTIQQAAAGAARASIAGLNTTEREAFARDYIENALNANAFVDPEKVLIEVGDNPAMEGSYRVVITYDAAELPIWNLIGSDLLPGPEIRRESVILNGGI
jgi:Flp pilus assembly protein TadG